MSVFQYDHKFSAVVIFSFETMGSEANNKACNMNTVLWKLKNKLIVI